LNACSHEVQKAFYSLIHERRIGEYVLSEGSVVMALVIEPRTTRL
jgi:hypothetical protein